MKNINLSAQLFHDIRSLVLRYHASNHGLNLNFFLKLPDAIEKGSLFKLLATKHYIIKTVGVVPQNPLNFLCKNLTMLDFHRNLSLEDFVFWFKNNTSPPADYFLQAAVDKVKSPIQLKYLATEYKNIYKKNVSESNISLPQKKYNQLKKFKL